MDPHRQAYLARLWAGADSGQGPMAYLRSSVSSVSIQALLVTLTTLLPVADCAPQYAYWNKTPTATLAVFATTFEQVYPALHAQLLQVATLRGVRAVPDRHPKPHCADLWYVCNWGTGSPCLYSRAHAACMCGLPLSLRRPTSSTPWSLTTRRCRIRDSAIFVRAAPSAMQHGAVTAQLPQGYSMWSSLRVMGVCPQPPTWTISQTAQWLYLWSCAVETLTRERFDETPEIALRHVDPAVFQGQGSAETFPSFVARLRLAYEATINELTMMGKPHRIPHEDPLVPLVYTKARRDISLKVLSMLQTT